MKKIERLSFFLPRFSKKKWNFESSHLRKLNIHFFLHMAFWSRVYRVSNVDSICLPVCNKGLRVTRKTDSVYAICTYTDRPLSSNTELILGNPSENIMFRCFAKCELPKILKMFICSSPSLRHALETSDRIAFE